MACFALTIWMDQVVINGRRDHSTGELSGLFNVPTVELSGLLKVYDWSTIIDTIPTTPGLQVC